MNQILEDSSLDKMIQVISQSNFDEAIALTKNIEVPLEQLEPYLYWQDDRYTRNCIVRNDQFELLLLCWGEGQKTAIHCHDSQECWVKVIDGQFKEEVYSFEDNDLRKLSTSEIASRETTSAKGNSLYHTLENIHSGRSISLHLYMKPIDKCTVYNKELNCFETKTLSYHSLEGELCSFQDN